MKKPALEPARASEIVEQLPLAVALLDENDQVVWTNRRFDERFNGDDLAACGALPGQPGRGNLAVVVHRLQPGGLRMVVLDDAPGALDAAAVRELRSRLEQLERAAMLDALTGLWNRRYLDHSLPAELSRNSRYRQPLAAALLDIDHFKQINDRLGHQAGDAVLKELAALIRGATRAADIPIRWGGEEFLVVMPCTAHGNAARAADKLRERIAGHRFALAGSVTASFGVTERLADEGAEAFFARLDRALYQAKADGRNRVVAEPRGASDDWQAQPRPLVQLMWDESYACGEPLIDEQHRELFRLANALIGASLTGAQGAAAFEPALEAMLQHVARHFRDEEAILERRGFASLGQHREAHRGLLARAAALKLAARRGEITTGALMDFLAKELVARHLLTADRDFHPLFE
ncbi:MAG TPA: diguanylate cyclase [Burkholderiales bacterium]|nr:diguanylate cyclase [Burkholderiales bacterium]